MSQDNVDAAASTASAASAAITAIATNPSIHDDAMDIDNSSAIELTLAAVGMTSSSKQKHINNPESPATSPLLQPQIIRHCLQKVQEECFKLDATIF